MHDAAPDRPTEVDSIDFWSFVAHAHRRLTSEVGTTHGLATELLLTLNRAANIVTYDLEASVHRPHGLSWSAFRLLFVTWLAGPIEPMNAARLTGMSRAAVSNLCKSLERDDLLTRTPAPQDGRSIRLHLTPTGEERIADVYRAHNEREQAWADALTEAEQRILILLLDKLITDRTQFDVRGRN
ncbi:MarR family winged helix-turn-helix transcriptional regulator [Nocardia fusca]|uniref:MarR family winged helix-turn-helix transcriptional regulator n=1 Tax=Nocardia TaxID=1817 RepID=UPI002453DFB0|nr:MarR family transcriptional regulator [Nocardia abscessus]